MICTVWCTCNLCAWGYSPSQERFSYASFAESSIRVKWSGFCVPRRAILARLEMQIVSGLIMSWINDCAHFGYLRYYAVEKWMSGMPKTAAKPLVLQLMVGDWSLFIHFHLSCAGARFSSPASDISSHTFEQSSQIVATSQTSWLRSPTLYFFNILPQQAHKHTETSLDKLTFFSIHTSTSSTYQLTQPDQMYVFNKCIAVALLNDDSLIPVVCNVSTAFK